MQNIKAFGAVGDGKTINTQAIQSAIDAGGMVYIPDGTYITGTLYLKSNGGLYLAPGARLLASHDRNDYNSADFCPQNQVWPQEAMAGTHLITAVNQENIFIAGYGTIDGDSHFWVNESRKEDYCDFWKSPPVSANRPAQMIFFAECKNIKVENINLVHSPFWHLFFHGCNDVIVKGVNICGERKQWVNDGIDIDCCSNVTVSDCIIDTGDDGITLRANGKTLVSKASICENVVISNCVITSYLGYGVRIGVGNGIIKNCMFSNIVFKDSLNGIGITCRYSPNGDCTSVENLSFNGITIEALRAFDLKISVAQNQPPLKNDGFIKSLSFNNVYAKTNRCCYLLGFNNSYCTDISFNNSKLEFIEEDTSNDRYTCNWTDIPEHSCVFYINKAKNITFNNFQILKNDNLSKAVLCENTEDFIER